MKRGRVLVTLKQFAYAMICLQGLGFYFCLGLGPEGVILQRKLQEILLFLVVDFTIAVTRING